MEKPADFFLGVLDFFAVLLPGTVATWLLVPHLPDDIRVSLTLSGTEDTSAVRWIGFLLTSYALGHFVFMAGSKLDVLYDQWRLRNKPIANDVVYQAASAVRRKVTPTMMGDGFSTFKWARSFVEIDTPQAKVEIDRLEATSKFFRGMVVLSALLIVHFIVSRPGRGDGPGHRARRRAVVLAFCEQRWKLMELTYATAAIV